ncbi:putative pectinesterase [Helianthus annuus]|nr:putative pectinesterase [Helianthus annuus]KAJ0441075.1 putative pectinesterase [Helianthus annuus]KAJ0643629.1 putative pectinesterase [Helianthus annuus]KAJ0807137.1 putative pectinesterase [Helianthus annuus]KAJ0834307.1 putative pectinesterase [Helianthus annuus]
MIILTVLVVICHDNGDCRWQRRTLDAGQRWRMVVAQANSRVESYRCVWQRVYSPRHGFPQHRRCFQAPGRCSNVDSRPICILPLPNDAFQDPLYAHANRQFYKECNIYGIVDFIFNNSAVVLQKCDIHPRRPMTGQQNTTTAEGKFDPNQIRQVSF